MGSWMLPPSACAQQLVHTLLLLNLQAGAFKIGDAAGTLDNIVACKLYRPGSVRGHYRQAAAVYLGQALGLAGDALLLSSCAYPPVASSHLLHPLTCLLPQCRSALSARAAA